MGRLGKSVCGVADESRQLLTLGPSCVLLLDIVGGGGGGGERERERERERESCELF